MQKGLYIWKLFLIKKLRGNRIGDYLNVNAVICSLTLFNVFKK